MKPALLIIDVQKQFYGDPVTANSLNNAVKGINQAIDLFRSKGLPIFAIRHVNEADGLKPGEKIFELPDDMNVLDTDYHIFKHYSNSFNKTELEQKLRELGVDTVIVSGYAAEYCVISTARGANDLDLNSIILHGAIGSSHPENIPFVESIHDVMNLGALRIMLS